MDILGLSETKQRGNGAEELRAGFHIYRSGGVDAKNGVAIIVSDIIKNNITEVINISDRLIKINIKILEETITILQCYAPQTGCPDTDKMDFETSLENHIRSNKTIIMAT